MNMLQFKLDNLPALDGGKATLAFDALVTRAAQDCLDRPADGNAREVTLKVTLKPVQEPGGDCTEVSAEIQCAAKVPALRTKPYSFALRRSGMLAFNVDSPDNVNQAMLLDDDR